MSSAFETVLFTKDFDRIFKTSFNKWNYQYPNLNNDLVQIQNVQLSELLHFLALELDSIELSDGRKSFLLRNTDPSSDYKGVHYWQYIQSKLLPNEAAIEFVHFESTFPSRTDSTHYAALLLLPGDSSPHFIPLCEERQIEALFPKNKTAEGISKSDLRARYLQNLYASPGVDSLPSLYQLIWQPLEQVFEEKGVKTVYYAPSGLLHRFNLAAIAAPDKSGQTLADRYHLIPVASTRQLAADRSEVRLPTSAIIYGGVCCDMDSLAIARANAAWGTQDTIDAAVRSGVCDDDLVGARKGAYYLYDLLTRQGINPILRSDHQATEESVKQIGLSAPSPGLLHFSTHGFSFPDPDGPHRILGFGGDTLVFKVSANPLIRSGLTLAGSNYVLTNKHPMPGMEDGILTADEVKQMNLSNTELVVLAACETGLGDIKGNEGVYGLQRAFRIAGAKNVLVSLWTVHDEATEELMTCFYQNWLEQKMPLRVALEEAQQWMRGQEKYRNPYYWAGFVLIGEL